MAKVIEFPKTPTRAIIERGREIGRRIREIIKAKQKPK